ncbi:MAG: heavy-metal-associated domain-containing protein [bacterium]
MARRRWEAGGAADHRGAPTSRIAAFSLCIGALSLLLTTAPASPQTVAQYTAGLSGLHCAATCGQETEARLARLPGVAAVEVNRNTRTVLITMQTGARLDRQAVAGALAGGDVGLTTFAPVGAAPATR